jgi:hypothetical protein
MAPFVSTNSNVKRAEDLKNLILERVVGELTILPTQGSQTQEPP